jgi:hypothetical protein
VSIYVRHIKLNESRGCRKKKSLEVTFLKAKLGDLHSQVQFYIQKLMVDSVNIREIQKKLYVGYLCMDVSAIDSKF